MQLENHLRTQILKHLQKRFGDKLFAIVLFGSRLRQTLKAFSDIDLLAILENLPKEQRKRRQIAASLRRELALPVDITLMSPATFISSVRNCIPLMIELACAYEIWYEKDDFFSEHIQFVQSLMQQKKLIQLQPGVWKLTEKVDEMAADGVGVSA
jgi:predicted nucleotidyltransferase